MPIEKRNTQMCNMFEKQTQNNNIWWFSRSQSGLTLPLYIYIHSKVPELGVYLMFKRNVIQQDLIDGKICLSTNIN